MISRRLLLVIAVVAGLLAGALYYAGARQVSVLVAARDLDATRPLAADDVITRSISLDAVPEGSLQDAARVVGRTLRAPLVRGQLVLSTTLADGPGAFASGLVPPRGTRAVALPANPLQALGGAIAPGSRVDVITVPVNGRAPAGRPVEMLASGVLVLDVRTESGAPQGRAITRAGPVERIGSLVVAMPVAEELRIADRISTGTFVFVLSAESSR